MENNYTTDYRDFAEYKKNYMVENMLTLNEFYISDAFNSKN